MSFERGKYGIVFTCDHCGDAVDTDEKNFQAAVAHIKEERWIIKQIGIIWRHFDSGACADAYQRDNS